ncbi:hypothetical protein SHAM105786_00185 [Shewanella amazonensis]
MLEKYGVLAEAHNNQVQDNIKENKPQKYKINSVINTEKVIIKLVK